MAIYHFSMQVISRGKGQSAIASAAYRSGERLYSERYDKVSSYHHRDVLPETMLLKPVHAPEWCLDRERLWNEVEKIEKAKNAQLAREFTVALPVELSKQQQRELLRHFVQEVFVDEGMVADVAIHRDDVKNPHAHVMLTMRPFLEDGSWGAKSRKEYIVDENGEALFTESGAKKSRKIDVNDWNRKEKLQQWRTAWAVYTNQHLSLAGVGIEISEKSHADLGLEQEPTIHEGYVARKMEQEGRSSDRVAINHEVKERNEKKLALQDVEQRLEQFEKHELILKALSPAEKQELGQLSKVLKMYVQPETLADKRRMLYFWDVKLQVQLDLGNFNEQSYKGFEAQEKAFKQAEELFEKEADRLLLKHYSTLDTSTWTPFEKREVLNGTARFGKTLNEAEVNEVLMDARAEEVIRQIQSIVKQPIATVVGAEERLQKVQQQTATFMQQHGISLQNKATIAILPEAERAQFEMQLKELKRLQLALKIFGAYYDERIHLRMPSLDITDKSLVEREWLVTAMDYYGEAFVKEQLVDFPQTPPKKYEKEQLQLVDRYLTLKQAYDIAILKGEQVSPQELLVLQKELEERFVKDLNHPRYRAFVLSDCIGEGILSEEQANRHLAVTVVQTRDGVVRYNDTFGGKQLKVYGAPFLFEQFFKGKAIDRILDELEYEEFEKLQAQRQRMRQQSESNQKRKRS
ncbi:MobQ family relaxase [Solibacillus sp. FSL R7-0668]|uniref:MobQ family relaxase n=1 Tax=Solibacillus sp. FSL R7-0668 TaxID=2921688 RepID=UPI0030FB4073